MLMAEAVSQLAAKTPGKEAIAMEVCSTICIHLFIITPSGNFRLETSAAQSAADIK